MLCKNCSYILTGKENFCPNCGNALERQGFSSVLPKEKKESINEKAKKPAEAPMSLDNMIFRLMKKRTIRGKAKRTIQQGKFLPLYLSAVRLP